MDPLQAGAPRAARGRRPPSPGRRRRGRRSSGTAARAQSSRCCRWSARSRERARCRRPGRQGPGQGVVHGGGGGPDAAGLVGERLPGLDGHAGHPPGVVAAGQELRDRGQVPVRPPAGRVQPLAVDPAGQPGHVRAARSRSARGDRHVRVRARLQHPEHLEDDRVGVVVAGRRSPRCSTAPRTAPARGGPGRGPRRGRRPGWTHADGAAARGPSSDSACAAGSHQGEPGARRRPGRAVRRRPTAGPSPSAIVEHPDQGVLQLGHAVRGGRSAAPGRSPASAPTCAVTKWTTIPTPACACRSLCLLMPACACRYCAC